MIVMISLNGIHSRPWSELKSERPALMHGDYAYLEAVLGLPEVRQTKDLP